MLNVTTKIQPPYQLVEWAQNNVPYIFCCKDRPWYYLDCFPPKEVPKSWDCVCFCEMHPNVCLTFYNSQNGKLHYYIGQCRRCSKVFWTRYEVEEKTNG